MERGEETLSENKDHSTRTISVVMAITLLGKVLGLFRDHLMAVHYGTTGMEAKAFYIASRIPRVFFDVVFASAIAACFIPVFSEYLTQRGKKEAFRFGSNFLSVMALLTAVLTVLGILFAQPLVTLFADGYDPQTAELAASLTRVMFPTVLFTGVAFSFVGILQAMDRFNIPALISTVSNLVIIGYFFFLDERFGVYGLAGAYLLGWLLASAALVLRAMGSERIQGLLQTGFAVMTLALAALVWLRLPFSLTVFGGGDAAYAERWAIRDEAAQVQAAVPEDAHISFYKQGEFTDLCAGPHLDSTGRVKGNAIKLTACNAAYWRGDSSRQTLQRIYGIAFPKKDELDAYLAKIEEAKKRDHRKLGRELGLFMLRDEGPGFPFFLPKGMTLKNTLLDYWRQVHKKYGYVEISTPIMLNRSLWERSGHWDHYKNNMYTTVIDEEDFAVKPMNCPGGMLVYKNEPHSYRDLPLRMAERAESVAPFISSS